MTSNKFKSSKGLPLIYTFLFFVTANITGLTALSARQPNIIVIYADDLGYGDLGCYGNPTIATPNLDRMALEGMRWTQFYSAAEVCTPSRAALLTGRLPPRSGMCSNKRRVLFPNSKGGLQADEITIAELLKGAGYHTGCIGKWHLGHLPEFLPTRHGFDEYYGIPYSNDMDRIADAPKGRLSFLEPKIEYFDVPLMRGEEIIERPADQTVITKRYTAEAIDFIQRNRDEPFFLYLAQTMPHIPLFRSQDFAGKSLRGLYGDVVEELDWGVGQILEFLRTEGLADNTLVVFSSDNGPWLVQGVQGGTAGLLREGKGSTWEGGMREPGIMWWPGTIQAGSVTTEVGTTMDLMATFAKLAGAEMPTDRVLDSFDLTPVLLKNAPSPRENFLYYRGYELMAIRTGPWKVHFQTQDGYGPGSQMAVTHDPPLVYHLEQDPGERYNVAAENPDVIALAKRLVQEHQKSYQAAPSQLER